MIVPAALLVAAGLFVAVAALRARAQQRVKNLSDLLVTATLDPSFDVVSRDKRSMLAMSGDIAERAFGRTRLLDSVRTNLGRTDWSISAGELVAVSIAAGALGAGFGVVSGSVAVGAILGAAGLFGPYAAVVRTIGRRRRAIEAQLPEVLDLLAASLEAGAGTASALSLVVAEVDEPAAGELARVVAATRLGTELEQAFREMADRIGSEDLTWTSDAIAIQQRTGGRLADMLRTVATFTRSREELRREVQALTAEGRLSGYVLGGLPFLIALVVSLANPGYLNPLFTTGAGLLMLAGTGMLMAVAFVVMFRIVKVEV